MHVNARGYDISWTNVHADADADRTRITPWNIDLFYLNFQLLEVVSRYRDPQLQVTENLSYRYL